MVQFVFVATYVVVSVLIIIYEYNEYKLYGFGYGSFLQFMRDAFDVSEILITYLFFIPICALALMLLIYGLGWCVGNIDVIFERAYEYIREICSNVSHSVKDINETFYGFFK